MAEDTAGGSPNGNAPATPPGGGGVALTPTAVLAKLFEIDPHSARFLAAGMAVFASAAIVIGWHVDVATMGLVGIYVVAAALMLAVVSNIPGGGKLVLGWFVVALIMIFGSAIMVAAILHPAWLDPPYCLVKFWEPCHLEEEAYTARNAAALDQDVHVPKVIRAPTAAAAIQPATATTGKPAVKRPDTMSSDAAAAPPVHKIYIQFAGLITRESIQSLDVSLARGGWTMASTAGGGERTGLAAGLNEVRYGLSSDQAAARALADAVTSTNITSGPVTLHYMPEIGPSNFELWISK